MNNTTDRLPSTLSDRALPDWLLDGGVKIINAKSRGAQLVVIIIGQEGFGPRHTRVLERDETLCMPHQTQNLLLDLGMAPTWFPQLGVGPDAHTWFAQFAKTENTKCSDRFLFACDDSSCSAFQR